MGSVVEVRGCQIGPANGLKSSLSILTSFWDIDFEHEDLARARKPKLYDPSRFQKGGNTRAFRPSEARLVLADAARPVYLPVPDSPRAPRRYRSTEAQLRSYAQSQVHGDPTCASRVMLP